MGQLEIEGFLAMLANERRVAVATHNQALSALLFLYREVLGKGAKEALNCRVLKSVALSVHALFGAPLHEQCSIWLQPSVVALH